VTVTKSTWRVCAAILAGATLVAACGDDDDDAGTTTAAASATTGGSATTEPSAETTAGASAQTAPPDTQSTDSMAPGTSDGGSATTAGAATGEPIRIGALMSTGGAMKAYSESYTDGTNFFASQFPTILGRPIEFVLVDDGATAATGVTAAQQLIEQEQVDIVIGPFLSGPTSAVLDPLNQAGLLNFNLSAFAATEDTSLYPYTFHVEWTKDADGKGQLLWACEQDVTSVATIVVNNPLGTETDESIKNNVDAAPCDVEYLGSQQFAAGATDALTQAEAVRDADLVVVGAASATDYATVVSSLHEVGFEGWISGNYALGLEATISLVPPEIVDQIVPMGATPRTTRPLDADVQQWLDDITEFLGRPPAANTNKAYDAMLLVKAAAEGAGSFDATAMREWLETNEICGMFGCYKFTVESHGPFAPEDDHPYRPGSEVSGFVEPWTAP
jgi:branched-chain amino acid transport system substrate-binding protein